MAQLKQRMCKNAIGLFHPKSLKPVTEQVSTVSLRFWSSKTQIVVFSHTEASLLLMPSIYHQYCLPFPFMAANGLALSCTAWKLTLLHSFLQDKRLMVCFLCLRLLLSRVTPQTKTFSFGMIDVVLLSFSVPCGSGFSIFLYLVFCQFSLVQTSG